MNYREYWIGKNTDYYQIWNAYENGEGYVQKFFRSKTHLIEIELNNPPKELPLFNQEVVYKTLKGYFHDLKRICLSENEYNSAGPLYIYEINRGSGIWSFLGELPYILLYGTTLIKEKIVGQRLDNLDKKLSILKEYFGDEVRPELYQKFMEAKTPKEIEFALNKIFNERIKDIRISKTPFNGQIEDSRENSISLYEKLIEDELNNKE